VITAPEIAKMEADFVARDGKFVMNVALNNYLKCPLEFYFKNLFHIPSPKNACNSDLLHYAIEQLFRKMQSK
jgi:DNA helicase-2/ATP-dependent DNA helicase PcrA